MDIVQLSMFDGKVCCCCQKWKPVGAFQKNKSTSDGLQKQCKECRKAGYIRVRDTLLPKKKQQYWTDPEKARAYKRQDHHKHKIIRNKRRLEYRATHLEADNNRVRQWSKAHPDRIRQIVRSMQSRRRARKRGQGGSHSADQWISMLSWFGSKCLACGSTENIQADHVQPIAKHGSDDISNIQPLCKHCNKKKFTKHMDYRDPDRLAAFLEHIRC